MSKKCLLEAFEASYETKEAKGLLRNDWRELNKNSPPATGFCYIAAEALFHLLDKDDLKPFCASYFEDEMKCTHWWLVKNKEIIDPTISQYSDLGLNPPYHLGRGNGFLTKNPSKRAKALMEIVLKLL